MASKSGVSPETSSEKNPPPTQKDPVLEDEEVTPKFTPEEEAADANTLFLAGDYENALSRYDDAINTCPKYLDYDRAVLQSNVAACCLKLEQWKDASKAATSALDGLAKFEREDPLLNPKTAEDGAEESKDGPKAGDLAGDEEDEVIEEIISSGAANAAPAPPPEPSPAKSELETRKADVLRIRTKALLRRARARAQEGGWQNLAGAEEDYKTLSQLPAGSLTPSDARTVRTQLRELPPRTKAAQEAEMGEMWGKLKTLGDGILKPFGLSTNNFQMVKDEATGGYSMNFNQGQGGASS
ncbi:hypothetical protein CC79DRAFT_1281308 [Sarocladium strictum]